MRHGDVLEHHHELRRARIRVVSALAHVHVVVWMDPGVIPDGLSQVYGREVGYDLVCAHVGARAGAALNHVHGEVRVMPVRLDQFIARSDDGIHHVSREQAQTSVCGGARAFDVRERAYELGIVPHLDAGDVVVIHGACGGDAVQRVGGGPDHGSEEIRLDPRRATYVRHVVGKGVRGGNVPSSLRGRGRERRTGGCLWRGASCPAARIRSARAASRRSSRRSRARVVHECPDPQGSSSGEREHPSPVGMSLSSVCPARARV